MSDRDRLIRAIDALRRIRAGETPDLDDAPRLEVWDVVVIDGHYALVGYVVGHQTIPDGQPVVTSALLAISRDNKSARTVSRWYRLGSKLRPHHVH